ncbi:MAG: hypothetical protein MI749_14430 [Desulfovibrionales bacterium]|nr:hypothetical protein [Desulfovibrionales bacterium]
MQERTQNIRAAARRLLEEKRVDCVIGYIKGTVPLRAQPFIAYTPEEADTLIWNSFCGGNLATHASGRKDKMAVVAQGCVSRNLTGLVHEKRLQRENLHVIGVPCVGMLDFRKIEAKLPHMTITSVDEGDESITLHGYDVDGADCQETLLRRDVKRDNCYTCLHRNPVNADETVAEPVEETAGGNIDFIAAPWEKLDADGRKTMFAETFASCIRCYSCRDVCPLCYCNTCFVDESSPQWCGKTQDPADVQTFHLLRAFHCGGRCTDCGACETACPQGIKMRRLTSYLERDVRRLWEYEPGMADDAEPPLATFTIEDPQEHFK